MGTWKSGRTLDKDPSFMWIKWFDSSWMKCPVVELALYHPRTGLKFWSDEPNWTIEDIKHKTFEYMEIEKPV